MLLKIDDRERNQEMFDAFDILGSENDFQYKICHLETGDVVCGDIVIERKEAVGDFIGSIIDGRLREQAAKMCLNFEHKYLIIEGNPYRTRSKISHNAIIGKMTSLAVKYNIKIILVETPQQFAYACWSIIKKHIEEGMFDPNDFKKLSYKVSDDDIVTAMILQIPGIGYDKAKQIAEKYNYSLITLTNNITKEELCSIEGIGEVTAEKVISVVTRK